MARIFITGSSTGLGLLAGQLLARKGHKIVLHARNTARAADIRRELPGVEDVITGDLETITGAIRVSEAANARGTFDAVIHNAGVLDRQQIETADGLPRMFAVNVLAPYIMTALIKRPKRLVYLSSSMHAGATANLGERQWENRLEGGAVTYSESKLYILMLAFAVARLWLDVFSNGVDPGWVPTRMGGASAPDDVTEGAVTQAALAAPDADDPLGQASGNYFLHLRAREPNPQSRDSALQDRLVAICEKMSGHTLN